MKSIYGDRDTVGQIYLDAQIQDADASVIVNDLSGEMMKGLCEDINNSIDSKPFGKKVWYLCVHEKKDLIMKRELLRRMICTKYRPYPEDDTLVYKIDSIHDTVEFCWCLPHTSEMDQVILNPDQYAKEYVEDVRAYIDFKLERFGFKQDAKGKPFAIPKFKDRPLKTPKCSP